MTKNTKVSSNEKVKIPIQGEEKASTPKKQDLLTTGFKIPHIDATVVKNGLLLVGAPIVSLLAALYVCGLVVSFIVYPVRFFALILSLLASLFRFLF